MNSLIIGWTNPMFLTFFPSEKPFFTLIHIESVEM